MSSLRRIESSRANGARSHGPVTDAGKQISSQNALRHGLVAKIVLLRGETPSGFEEGLVDHLQRFRPADAVEYGIIEEMVAAQWRMRRAWCLETKLLNSRLDIPDPGDGIAPFAGAFKDPDDSRGLALLGRYEARHHNVYWRSLKNLLLLRASFPPDDSTPVYGLDPVPDPAGDAPAGYSPAPAPDPPPPPDDPNGALPKEPSPIFGHLDPQPPDPPEPSQQWCAVVVNKDVPPRRCPARPAATGGGVLLPGARRCASPGRNTKPWLPAPPTGLWRATQPPRSCGTIEAESGDENCIRIRSRGVRA